MCDTVFDFSNTPSHDLVKQHRSTCQTLPDRSPMAATSIDVASLHAALDAARTTKELSLRQLSGLLDLTPATLSRLANGFTPDTVAFTSVVTWLNIPAEESINSGRGGWILGCLLYTSPSPRDRT